MWEAHRSHFYQKATDNGFSALEVSAHVFGLNLVLAGFATMTLIWSSGLVQVAFLAVGTGGTAAPPRDNPEFPLANRR